MSYFMKRNNQIKVRSLLVLINGKDIFYQSINAPNNIYLFDISAEQNLKQSRIQQCLQIIK
jgi:hypothetical protein